MNVVYKYELCGGTTVAPLRENDKVLSVDVQGSNAVMWVLIDTDSPHKERYFQVVYTGERFHGMGWSYVGTFTLDSLVYHVFETPNP